MIHSQLSMRKRKRHNPNVLVNKNIIGDSFYCAITNQKK